MNRIPWTTIAAALYLLGAIASYGHFVARGSCPSDAKLTVSNCIEYRSVFGLFIAPAWPLYFSYRMWS